MKKSTEIQWDTETQEYYQFLFRAWNVRKAKEIIVNKPRNITEVNIEAFIKYIQRPKNGQINIMHSLNWERIDNGEIDLTIPLIFAKEKDYDILIDGWHRVAKAIDQHVTILSAVFLNKTETKKVAA